MRSLLMVLGTLAIGAVLAGPTHAAPVFDVTAPTDYIEIINGVDDGDGTVADGGGNNPPPAEGVANVIDNNAGSKYLNFLDLGSGFKVRLDSYGAARLTGIALTTANDSVARDPDSVTIQGSNDDTTWSPIITNFPTPLPGALGTNDSRGVDTEFPFTPLTAGDFLWYSVVFPTVKALNPGDGNSMQIAEARLMSDDVAPPPFDLTMPGDTVVGTSGNWPGGPTGPGPGPGGDEGPAQAIDDSPVTKYLNFDKLAIGLIVTLDSNGPAALNGIALTTANDSPERDPATVTITAWDGAGWVPIITDLPVLGTDPGRQVEEVYAFAAETGGAYGQYQIVFPTVRDEVAANSMQIAEIRLLPEPATLALVGLGVAGLVARRRRA